jgi:ubiquinone/menaquinone biosynthesis C-methylase UbiE
MFWAGQSLIACEPQQKNRVEKEHNVERWSHMSEKDYVLGTHDEELLRLGLQHRVWRPVVLDCWQKAGITTGKRILDLGAGPGYAALDLAEIVGPSGEVVALERSDKFVAAMRESFHRRGLSNVKIYELDLMTGDLPKGNYDFSWCRWVLSFVSDQALLIKKLSGVMPKGGISIFHEYAHYGTWRFLPPIPSQEKFREHVVATWRESGGEPDGAADLPVLLSQNGFIVRSATPHIFCVRPTNYMWQWPVTFIEVYLPRLIEIGRIDQIFADKVRADLAGAGENPNALMITPLVVEIVAERVEWTR